MRLPVRHRLPLFVAVCALFLLSCGREVTGPENGIYRNRVASLAFAPAFSGPMATVDGAGDAVPFERVRIVLRGLDGNVVKDTMVDFPSDADEVELTLMLAIPQNSPAEGLPLSVTMAYINAAGDTVFRGGPNSIIARPLGSPGANTPVDIPVTYDGAGKDATRVAISPKTGSALAGTSTAFSATAFDAADQPIPNTPFVFSTPDVTRATVNPVTGVVNWLSERGTVRVIAELPNGARADTATFVVELPASRLALGAGDAQSGAVNAPLADTIVVRTLAADDLPVAGIAVELAVASGGGSLEIINDTSDANGDVRAVWTLGAELGAQSLTVVAEGLSGSPITITATALPAAPVRLEITQQPTDGVAGAALAPALSVIARDAYGNAVPSFNADVTVSVVGAEPPTLDGTLTRAAENGSATFDDLVFSTAGTHQLVVSSGTLASDTTNAIAIAAAAATQLAIIAQPPATIVAGADFGASIEVQDAFGNRVTDWAAPMQAVFEESPAGASFLSGGTADVEGGEANFTDLQLGVAGVYRLRFTSGALTAAVSDAFEVLTAGAEAMNALSGDQQSGIAGTALDDSLVVAVSDNFGNPVSGVTINWTVASGSGSLSAVSSLTDAAGRAAVRWTLGNEVGEQVVTASAGFLPEVEFTATATPGAAAAIVLTATPTFGTAGSILAPLSAEVQDALGNVVSGYAGDVSVAIVTNPGGATLGGTLTRAATAGIVSFDDLIINTVAAGYTLRLSLVQEGIDSDTTASIGIAPADPSLLLLIDGDAQSAVVHNTLANPLRARVTDAFGNGVSGVNVDFNLISGLATLGAPTVPTDADGYAAVGVQMDSLAGPVVIGAYAPGLTPDSLVYTLTALPAAPSALLVVGGEEQTISTGGETDSLRVRLIDGFGNPIAGATVTWDSPSDIAFSSASSITDANGYAATTAIANGTTGLLDAYARFANPELSAYFTVNVQAGAAASLHILTSIGDLHAGEALPTLVVELRDAYGNLAVTSGGSVEIGVDPALTNGPIDGTLVVEAVEGLASFSELALTQTGPYALVVSASGLAPDTTEAFNVLAGEATSVEYVGPSAASGVVGGATTVPLAIRVLDAYGNPVPGAYTYWYVSLSNMAQLDSTEIYTDALGIARATVQLPPLVESFIVTASALDAGVLNFSVSSTNAPAAALEITQQTDGEATAGATLTPLEVTVRDQYENPALDFNGLLTVTIESGPDGATLGGTLTLNAVAGVATFSDLTLDLAGTYTLRVEGDGLDYAVSDEIAVSAGAAEIVAIVDGDGQSAEVGSDLPAPLRMRVTDRFGNPVAGADLMWVTHPNITVGEVSMGTDVNGIFTAPVSFGNTAGTYEFSFALAPAGDSTVTFTLTALPGPAYELVVITAPETAVAGDLVTYVIEARDTYGNVATGFEQDVTIEAIDAVGEALGVTTVQAVAGVATFTEVYFEVAGNYFMVVSAGDVNTSYVSIDVTAAEPTQLVVSEGDNQTNYAGFTLENPIVLRLTDALGNPIEGAEILVTRGIGTGNLGNFVDSLRSVTDYDGRLFVSWTLGPEAGTQTLHAETETLGPITVTANALEQVANFIWTGNANTDPGNPSNWSTFTLPSSTDSVLIPAGRPNYPTLTGWTQWRRLTVEDGAQLNLANSPLYVTGSVRTPLTGVTSTGTSGVLSTYGSGTITGGFSYLRIEGTHTTDGVVRVANGLTVAGGSLVVGTGDSLHVDGNIESYSPSLLEQQPGSALYIGGDLWAGAATRFGAGSRTYVYGDVRTNQTAPVDAILADSTHQLFLMPGRTQDISLWYGDVNLDGPCTWSCFGRVIALKEGTTDGVSFGSLWSMTGAVRARGGFEIDAYEITTGSSGIDLIAGAPSTLRTEEWSGFRRLTFNGAVDAPRIYADTLVAIGTGLLPTQLESPMRVIGNRQIDGEIYAHVLVDGSLDVVGPNATVNGNLQTRGSGYIRMTDQTDYLTVYGDLLLEGTADDGQLSDGILDVYGNVLVGLGSSIRAAPTHTLHVRGPESQIDVLDDDIPHLGSMLVNDGYAVTFVGNVLRLSGDLRIEGTDSRLGEARPSTVHVNRLFDPQGNLEVGTVYVDGSDGLWTPSISSNLVVRGRSQLNGNLVVNGELSIDGEGELSLGGHRATVLGDFYTAALGTLRMVNAADTIEVHGSAYFGGGNSVGQLTNGVFELFGNLSQYRGEASNATFYGTDQHTLRFVSFTTSYLNFETSNDVDGSRIGNLKIEKQDGEVILMSGDLVIENVVDSFINAGFTVGTGSSNANLYVLGSVSPTISANNRGFSLFGSSTVNVLRGVGEGCTADSIRVNGSTANFTPQACVQPPGF